MSKERNPHWHAEHVYQRLLQEFPAHPETGLAVDLPEDIWESVCYLVAFTAELAEGFVDENGKEKTGKEVTPLTEEYIYTDRMRIPTMHIMVGMPRSGKTTHVEEFVKGAEFPITIVSKDDIRRVFGHRFYGPLEAVVRAHAQAAIAAALIRGLDVVVDECNITQNARKMLVDIAKTNNAHWQFIVMSSKFEELVERAEVTGFPISVLEQFREDYEPVTEAELEERN